MAHCRSCINYWMLWKGLGFRLSTGLWHLSRTLSTLRSQSSLFMLPGFYIPLTLPCPQGPLPSLTLQSTKENPHVYLLLASAPLIPPLCLCPSLSFSPTATSQRHSLPLPYPLSQTLLLHLPQQPSVASDIFLLSLWLFLNNSSSKLTLRFVMFSALDTFRHLTLPVFICIYWFSILTTPY